MLHPPGILREYSMVCCTIIAALLALLLRPFIAMRANPLEWRLAEAGGTQSGSIGRAETRFKSFSFALAGWKFVARSEPNMRIHIVASLCVVALGLILQIPMSEWRWLVIAIATVFVAEALNTAIEQACNATSREFNPAIKAAKDVAAGAVLIAAIAAGLIGASVFLPQLVGGDHMAKQPSFHSMCHGNL